MPASHRRRTPTKSSAAGRRHATQAISVLGERVAQARRNRRLTQRELAARLGLHHSRLSQIEAGRGEGVPADLWFALADALGIRFRMEFGRDPTAELEDAAHLDMQEVMLALARRTGRARTFELATKPSSPAYSADVGVRDDDQRVLIVEECWNRFANIGAGVRSTRRKVAEAEELAVAVGGDRGPYRVSAVWIVRDTAHNREVLGRYPEVFATAFDGDSRHWSRALTLPGAAIPAGLGLVMCDLARRRLHPLRR